MTDPSPPAPANNFYPSPPPPSQAATANANSNAPAAVPGTGQQRELGKNALRRPHRKSRLGCVNCKARRVKCDESHPTCGFCQARQLACQYPEPVIPQTQPSHVPPDKHSLSPESPSHPIGTPQRDARFATYGGVPSTMMTANTTAAAAASSTTPTASARPSPPVPLASSSPESRRNATDIAVAMAAVTVAAGPLPAPSNTAPSGPPLHIDELELLLNFTCSTVNSMSRHGHILDLWREGVPRLALDHPFLMHAILALSSAHLGRFPRAGRRGNPDFYFAQAKRHWLQAEKLIGPLLAGINEDTCHAMYIFALVAAFFTLARGPTADVWHPLGGLGMHDSSLEWCLLTRAIVPSNHEQWARLERGPVGPLASLTMNCMAKLATPVARPEAPQMRRLRDYIIDAEARSPDLRDRYLRIVNGISQCYSVMYDENGFPEKDARDLGWFSFVAVADDTGFVDLLNRCTPNALIIYAYALVVLKDVDFGWMFEGWPHHTISNIYNRLEQPYRVHLSWPIQRLGWVPPG